MNLAINPADFAYRLLHTWDNRDFAGLDNSQSIPLFFPYALSFTLFQYFGFSLPTIQKIWFILIFVLSGFSMYYLVFSLTKNRFAGFISAIFFMYNIPKVDRWFAGDFHAVLMFGILPLTLIFFIKGLDVKDAKIKYCILIALTSLFFTNWNPSSTVAVLFIFLIYFLFHTIITKFKLLGSNLKFIILTMAMAALLNSYWLYPMVKNLMTGVFSVGVAEAVRGDLGWLRGVSRNTSFLRLLRLTGEWFWNMPYEGEEQALYSVAYLFNPLLIIITYTVPLLAFSALLFKSKDKNVLFFSISAMAYILLTAGAHPPTGKIYEWFFQNVPGFFLFRSPYQRFSLMIALCYAFLIGISGSEIYNYLKQKRQSALRLNLGKVALGVILVVILISAWPLFTSHISHSKGKLMPKFSISIPRYYKEAEDWLERAEKKDARLLILPDTASGAIYNWGYSGGTDIVQHLFSIPQISGTPRIYSRAHPPTFELTSKFYEVFHHRENRSLYKILRLLNIKRILLRNDINTTFYRRQRTPQESKKAIDFLSTRITYEKSLGKLDFYKISDGYFLSHIYACP